MLMIDWDLEAPGLENFFKDYLRETDWKQQKGVLEWLYAQRKNEEVKWQDWVIKFKVKETDSDLHLLVSGKDNGNYSEMLRDFNVAKFYEEHEGGHRIERFREELLSEYDYVLIDSRTGVTDFGGICTIQMPDILVMLFAPTEQGLSGTKKIAQRILESHSNLPFDRYSLLICPIPSRFDSTTEFHESRKWLERIATELEWLYESWLPASANLNEVLQIIKIPYISYFSFGEKLPVIEQGVSDPAGLGYAYENLAMLLGRGLDEVDVFVEKRDVYLEQISGQKPEQDIYNFKPSKKIEPVRIFISAASDDEPLKLQVETAFKSSRDLSDRVEFVESGSEFLGRSRKAVLEEMIRTSDILLVIFSQDSFMYVLTGEGPYEIKDFDDEFRVIKDYKYIPIFRDSGTSKGFRKHYDDRVGINLFSDNGDAAKLVVEKVAPLIHERFITKI
ncbi:MAG: hypothetical protein IPJ82_18590 [Lewinellaceae bacterium]|nr:hypothetical protein [Lewinellaceae bacterium]